MGFSNESDFRERFEELKDEYARSHGFYGEDDEFISTWWENDENLHAAESYAYDMISKENQKTNLDDVIKSCEEIAENQEARSEKGSIDKENER